MPDQAQGLRALADRALQCPEPTSTADPAARQSARTVAITSGKGGVGKTNLSANLAIQLGLSGVRVVVLDADLGLANTHMLLGATPRYRLDHVMRGECSLRDAATPAAANVDLVAGASDVLDPAFAEPDAAERLAAELGTLDTMADMVLVDTGAGLSSTVLAFVLTVDEVMVVTTPEPTAIADAYATLKVVTRDNPSARLCLVVNMARSEADAGAAARRLQLVCRRFLGVEVEYLGWVPQDAAVPGAVRAQRPFALAQPGCPASLAVGRIAGAMGYRADGPRGAPGFVSRLMSMLAGRARPVEPAAGGKMERIPECPTAS